MYGFGKMGSTILGSMSDLSLAGGAQTRRRPRKLTILLHPPEYAVRHVGGVNALALAPNYGGAGADQLYTGGRDGTVRAWNVDGDVSEPTCAGTMEGHSSWVNALATVRSSSGAAVLLSGASDRTVKAWALDGREGSGRDRCVSRVERHADYVTRLAAPTAPGATRFASAGLGGDQVYLWDIEAVARPAASAPRDDAALVRAMEGQTDSAYALAMDATGTTIVSGCSAGTVRVWDVRDSSAPVKLRGHSGNARCAAMDPTGRLCITGSSDGTIRLWDVGQRRCVQTMGNVHRRGVGVWSVAMDESWHAAYSGGADGRVHVTDVARRRTAPLFQEPAGVIDLRLADDGASVWAATMSSRVRRWSTRTSRDAGGAKEKARRRVAEPGAWFSVKAEQNESATEADHLAETAKPRNHRVTVAKPDPHPPTHAEPLATIAGAPPIVEHAQLTDRTRVLAKDAEGGVSLWDVTRFEQTKAWPPGTDFAATREAESPKVSIPAWFQVDSRSGSLAVTLAPYSAFQAEAYAADMGLEGANDETKINVGAQTVHALLRKWAAARRAAAANAGDVGEDVGAVDGGVAKRDVNALRASEDAGAYPSPRAPPILMFESPSGSGSTVLMPTACLQGTEEEEAALPDWIAETAAGTYRVPDAPKASFYLNPAPDQDLPALSQGKVTAPRVLGIRKVCVYVISKLNLDTSPDVAPDRLVEILCNGKALDPKMSLATVKEFVWKRGDDVQLQYRLREGVKMKAEDRAAEERVASR